MILGSSMQTAASVLVHPIASLVRPRPPFDPRRGFYIGAGVFEDAEGVAWALNPQRGWIACPGSSQAVIAARKVRVLLRHRYGATKAQALRCAARLGPYAAHALELGYQ